MKKTNKKGFTIVELVIVIAVIAILAGVLIPTFSGIVGTANKNKALQEVKNAYTATLADDMANSTKVVFEVNEIYVQHENGTYIAIVDGEAVIIDDLDGKTVNRYLNNGKLQEEDPAAATDATE